MSNHRRHHHRPEAAAAPLAPPTYAEPPRRHRSSARRERRRRDYSPEPVDHAYYSDDEHYYSDDPAYHRRRHRPSRRNRTYYEDDHSHSAPSYSPPSYSSSPRPHGHRAHSSESYPYSEDDTGYENARRTSALKAALTAGALEAYRSRHAPGGITGRHALARGAQAALGAGTLEYMGGNSRTFHGHHEGVSGTGGLLKSVAGSLLTQKVLSGGANSRRGRSHGRYDEEGGSGGTLKKVIALATAARAGSRLLGAVRNGNSGARRSRRYSG